MTNVSGTCYTSVLTIPTPQYFNGTTVICKDGIRGDTVGNDTLNVQLACKLLMSNCLECPPGWTAKTFLPFGHGYLIAFNGTSL